jgi:acyl-homoserine-lactone acylase
VTITRDRAGIPHIVAGSFTALGYGEAYAFAADNLCTFANDIVTVEGQRSRYFGPNGEAVNYSADSSSTNLESDLYWRYVRAGGIVEHWLTAKPPNGLLPAVREVYTGFVAGYNRFLRSGRLHDRSCEGKPWVHPITLTDMALRGEQLVTEGSAQQFLSGIADAAPPSTTAHAAALSTGSAAPLELGALRTRFGGQASRELGSNGVALGARDTRAGDGMLLTNPHFPWRGPERYWMAQLTVPGRYDTEGATVMGFPLIALGFNRHTAWTGTTSTSRRFVIYRLALVPGDPTSYYLDGKVDRMRPVTVGVRYGSTTVRHTFYKTRWGLVMDVPQATYGWGTEHAYALYDPVASVGPRTANHYLRIAQATSVRDLYKIEAKWLADPTSNTIAADDRGNAYYGDVGTTPAVSPAEIRNCMPAGLPTEVFDAARVVTLDGARTACAPATVDGTPEHGIFGARSLPHLFRRDYVENSNDSYWLANPSHPLTGFSPIIGLTGTPQGLRTRLGNEMIAERMNGSDHLGPPKFTIPTLQRMWEGDRDPVAELVLRDLVADCRAHPSAAASNGHTVDLTAACAALAGYDGTGSLDATGGWLFSVWNGLDSDSPFFASAFDPAKPLTTPSGLDTAPPAAPLRWLADAVLNLQAHGVPLNAGYGAVQHAPQSSKIPIHGCPNACFNAVYAGDGASSDPATTAPYGRVFGGSSVVMTTEMTPTGPISEGIVTYSQATDRSSPWYENMTKLFSRKRWVRLPFTAAQLRRDHPLRPLVLRLPIPA